MTVRATWNGTVLAESDRTILVEGNHYFPIEDVATGFLEQSPTTSHCPWKGDASYHHIVVDGQHNHDAAWYYPDPYDAAIGIKGYIAFWKRVEMSGVSTSGEEIVPPR